jgi:ubiquinone/menaquinone biosynthesis C-methylase UbiE
MNTQLKLKFYYDFVLGQVYDEGHSDFHQDITQDVVAKFIDPMDLPKTASVMDLGCGPGYFLDAMKSRNYTNVTGVTLSIEDANTCLGKGHSILRSDMNFLSVGDESQDLLFCRHSLEHSPFPYITLLEYNRVLKPQGYLYVEVPQPNCDHPHENNRNHYSIMDRTMWLSLLQRTGFDIEWHEYSFPLTLSDDRGTVTERYYIFVCRRQRSVDVK